MLKGFLKRGSCSTTKNSPLCIIDGRRKATTRGVSTEESMSGDNPEAIANGKSRRSKILQEQK
ncbi:MAG: hypothetical protein WAM26_17310 [Nitrososphaeraceae archaeon]